MSKFGYYFETNNQTELIQVEKPQLFAPRWQVLLTPCGKI